MNNNYRLFSLVEEEFVASEESIASKVSWVSGYNLLSILLYIFFINHMLYLDLLQNEFGEVPQPRKKITSKRGEIKLHFSILSSEVNN